MKIFFIFLFFSNAIWAICPDPKKVVLFLDTNASYSEVLAAKEGAIARCETLVVYPGEKQSKDYYNLSSQINKIYKQAKCNEIEDYNKSDECYLKAQEKAKPYGEKLEKIEIKEINGEGDLKELFQKLKNKKISVTSLVISGHDGGGHVSGSFGYITKQAVTSAFNEVYKDSPLKNNLKSLYLWGCYTATTYEVLDWDAQLPSLNFIVGYNGVAPGNTMAAAKTILADALKKEAQALNTCNQKELKRVLNGIRDINYTTSGLFLQNACNKNLYRRNNAEYITDENNEYRSTKLNTEYIDLGDEANCEVLQAHYGKHSELITNFMYYDNPPFETSGTTMREAYSFVRQNLDNLLKCNFVTSASFADRVGLLLFWHNVKINFFKKYKDQLNKLNSLIQKVQGQKGEDIEEGINVKNQLLTPIEKSISELEQQKQQILAAKKETIWNEMGAKEKTRILKEAKSLYVNKSNKKMFQRASKKDKDIFLFNEWFKYGSSLPETPGMKKSLQEIETPLIEKYEQKNKLLAERQELMRLKYASEDLKYTMKDIKPLDESKIAKMTRQDILDFANATDTFKYVLNNSDSYGLEKVIDKDKDAKETTNFLTKLNQYLYDLDPNCMNFLEWHEVAEGHIPNSLCE